MHGVAALGHLEGGDALGVGLAQRALAVGAELHGCALHGLAGLVGDVDAVHTGVVCRGALGSGVLALVQTGGDAALLQPGRAAGGEQSVNGALIGVHSRALHGLADQRAGLVHEEGGGESAHVKQLVHIVGGQDDGVGDALLLQNALGGLHGIGVGAVIQQADNGAVLARKAAVDGLKLGELTHAGAAPACPDVQHGDLMPAEELLAGDGIAVDVGGAEAELPALHPGKGIDRHVELGALDDLLDLCLHCTELIGKLGAEGGDVLVGVQVQIVGVAGAFVDLGDAAQVDGEALLCKVSGHRVQIRAVGQGIHGENVRHVAEEHVVVFLGEIILVDDGVVLVLAHGEVVHIEVIPAGVVAKLFTDAGVEHAL